MAYKVQLLKQSFALRQCRPGLGTWYFHVGMTRDFQPRTFGRGIEERTFRQPRLEMKHARGEKSDSSNTKASRASRLNLGKWTISFHRLRRLTLIRQRRPRKQCPRRRGPAAMNSLSPRNLSHCASSYDCYALVSTVSLLSLASQGPSSKCHHQTSGNGPQLHVLGSKQQRAVCFFERDAAVATCLRIREEDRFADLLLPNNAWQSKPTFSWFRQGLWSAARYDGGIGPLKHLALVPLR